MSLSTDGLSHLLVSAICESWLYCSLFRGKPKGLEGKSPPSVPNYMQYI
jgi:hypothetical protein